MTNAGRASGKRTLPVELGARIMARLLREARGARTLSEVASRAGTSVSVICDVEHARLLPSQQKLRDILCLGCGLSKREFNSLVFDFRLEYFLQSDTYLSGADRSEVRSRIHSIKARARDR